MKPTTRADRLIKNILRNEPIETFAAQAGEVLANEGFEFELTSVDGNHLFTNNARGLVVEIKDDLEGGFQWTFSNGYRGMSVETLQGALRES